MARCNKLTKASVFEDTKTPKADLSRRCQRHKDAKRISQGTIIHSCEHIAIRFGNVKPL